jgi:hypothetical protein
VADTPTVVVLAPAQFELFSYGFGLLILVAFAHLVFLFAGSRR